MTTREFESMVNKNAKTKVKMLSEFSENGQYKGRIRGISNDEVYDFLDYILKGTDVIYNNLVIRSENPPISEKVIEFNINNWKEPKKSFLKRLFG